MNTIKILLFIALSATTVWGQRGGCGLTHDHQEILAEQVADYNMRAAEGLVQNRSVMDRFVPVEFHIVNQTDGSGGVPRSAILNQLARLNRDFKETGLHFYLNSIEDIPEINSNILYNGPASNGSALDAQAAPNAMNVFITGDASTGSQLGGTTLGYYTPQYDYIVTIVQEVQDTSNTLSHEAGHFFSLPHTHRGWDSEDYEEAVHGNPLNSSISPGGVPVEKADGSNCADAGDRICDTPADYNFGFRNNGCFWNKAAKDIKDHCGVQLDPMTTNQMGYFSDCNKYFFTPMQQEIVLDNYDGGSRAYLRSSYVPVSDELVGKAEIITPAHNSTLDNFDDIQMDWEDVEGATHYLIEMSNNSIGFNEYWITTESELFIDELAPDERFSYRIYPFNEGNTEFERPSLRRFTTGNRSVSVNEVEGISGLTIFPNPLPSGESLKLTLEADHSFDGEVRMTSIDGTVLYQQSTTFVSGDNRIEIINQDIPAGLYIVSIETETGVSQKKVIVQ